MINLRTITKENIEDILNLSVSEEQKGFVSDNSESLAQAYVYHDTAWPFAIYEDDTPVGFIMMGVLRPKILKNRGIKPNILYRILYILPAKICKYMPIYADKQK